MKKDKTCLGCMGGSIAHTCKVGDREIYFSFDRRCHDVNELKEMFDLIGYGVRTHGQEEDGFQDHFFLEPKEKREGD